MKKQEKILIISLLILILILVVPKLNLTEKITIEKYAYTAALCDEKEHCEDFFIECEGQNLVRFAATGYSIETENTPKNSIDNFCD